MDELLKPCEDNLEAMRGLLNNSIEQDQIIQCVKVLENTIVNLSKYCVNTLIDCNEQFLSMNDQVNAVEGLMHIVKDSVGNKSQFHGNERNYASNSDILNIDSKPSTQIQLPSCAYDISMNVLDNIGHKSETLGQGSPLIRKVQQSDQEIPIWSKQADFFVMEKGDSATSFSQKYKVQSPSFGK